MRATLMYGAGEVRVEDVPDARLIERTDALVRVTRAAICGSDLWPYKTMEPDEQGRRMGDRGNDYIVGLTPPDRLRGGPGTDLCHTKGVAICS